MKVSFLSIFLVVSLLSMKRLTAQTTPDMLENALTGVVTVAVYKTAELQSLLGFRGDYNAPEEAYKRVLDLSGAHGSGSGFVIDYNGEKLVITNSHVIQAAAKERGSIYVYSISQDKYEVEIVGGDTFYDFAVLRFLQKTGDDIAALKYSDSPPRIGQKVYAIGNPLGDFPYSVSDGIISAINRSRDGLTGKFGFLQTTATLIWGNSGGPLLNEQGEVVGINSQIEFTQSPDGGTLWQSQINFALETKIAKRLTQDILENKGMVRRSYFGMEISEIYEYYNESYFPQHQNPILSGITPGSPSATVLKPYIGTEILSINGNNVRNVEEVLGELEEIKPGDPVQIIFAGNKPVNVKSTELNARALTEQAAFVLTRIPNIQIDLDSPLPTFYLVQSNNLYAYGEDKKFNAEKNNFKDNPKDRYTILAGGIMDEYSPTMYRISKLSELGAALRLTGLSGIFDFACIREEDPNQEVIIQRYTLSEQDNVVKRCLWY